MTRTEFRERVVAVLDRLEKGCGDGSCRYHKPLDKPQMATNNQCRCNPRDLREMVWLIIEDSASTRPYAWDVETKEQNV